MNYYAHETAIIESDVQIGEGTRIWVNSQIRSGAIIGKHCNIGKDTFIDQGTQIGNNVKIQNGVSIYKGVVIDDDVFVGPNAVFTNDLHPRAMNTNWIITKTSIRKGASIGANATIVCGVELGENCMVGAGSVVTRSVPDHALVVGNPAKRIGWVCKCGKRADGSFVCDDCKKADKL